MKSTYEKRWGHPRNKKAVKHLEVKARKQAEAKQRQIEYLEAHPEIRIARESHGRILHLNY